MFEGLVALRSVFESCSIAGSRISRKLQIEGMATFALSPGKSPYKIAVYTPGNKVKQSTYIFSLISKAIIMLIKPSKISFLNGFKCGYSLKGQFLWP